jgi:hypothetical protein
MILSNEWTEEVERSSEEIQIHVPPSTVQCKIHGMMVEVLYNPTVRANIMSATFASTYFDNESLAPTVKTYRKWSMQWEKDGKISYLMHCGHTGQLIKLPLASHHSSSYIRKAIIYQLSLNTELTGP